MSKRINIILPESTVAVLDRVAPKGNRSRFIDRAVLRLVQTEGTANLRERLKAGALANAKLDLELAEEWFPVEQEAWQRLEREEQAAAKATPKSSGRLKISGHEDDNRIYECAVAARADYIVTENSKHFKKPYKTTRIVNARQLLELLKTGTKKT